MLTDFNLYMKSFANFIVVTDNIGASEAKKKALLQAVGGPDMVFLFEYLGKVVPGDTYDAATEKIRVAITGQTNQAMIRFKLFTGMAQESQTFSTWWARVKEQADKCVFNAYDSEKAARDALLFQTSDMRLRKKVLAEDLALDDMVKFGLAYEQTQEKAEQINSITLY